MKKNALTSLVVSLSLFGLLSFSTITGYSQATLVIGNLANGTVNEYAFPSGDKIYTVDGTNFASSTSNVCVGATRRVQLNAVILQLVSTSAGSIAVQGGSSGATSTRTIKTVEVADTKDGTYTTVSDINAGGTINSTIVSDACGTITVNWLTIPIGKFVKISFVQEAASTNLANIRLSGFNITSAVAPVKFGAINLSQTNGLTRVDWNVLSEVNTDKYVVERSDNGSSFYAVGGLSAINAPKYTYIDNTPLNATGYYRIKAVDKDGSIGYSSVVKIGGKQTQTDIAVAPNPVKGGQLNIQMSNFEKGTYSALLFDATGKQVFGKSINVEAANGAQTLQLPSTVQPGIYQLQVTNGVSRITKTVMVQ